MTTTAPPGAEVILVDGEEYLQWKAVLRVPVNWTPEKGVMVAFAPPGGIANLPALVQGEDGKIPVFRNINVVELEPDDPTDASAEWTLAVEATDTVGPLYDLTLTLHRGEAGADGVMTILTAGDFDDTGAAAGMVLALKSNGAGGYDGVEAVTMKVGNLYWPTSIATISNATGANALCAIAVGAQPFGYRLAVEGQQTISPDGPDIQVDVIARLGTTSGDIIARGQGLAGGAVQNLILSPVPAINAAPGFGEVSDGAAKTVYVRLEQVGSGTDTFDAVSGRGFFGARVEPLR